LFVKRAIQKTLRSSLINYIAAGVQELKIVENFDIHENEEFEIDEEEIQFLF
jgi:hypothetical protein